MLPKYAIVLNLVSLKQCENKSYRKLVKLRITITFQRPQMIANIRPQMIAKIKNGVQVTVIGQNSVQHMPALRR